MKYQIALLALTVLAECVPQLGLSGPAWKHVGTKEVKPKYRTSAKRVILKYGPLNLAGKDVSIYYATLSSSE
jgi:hypothetical protein